MTLGVSPRVTCAHHWIQDDTRDLVWLTLSHTAVRTLAEFGLTIDVAMDDVPGGTPNPNTVFTNNWVTRHAD